MKRVLIVSPHFPPTNAADMHRVRMVLPFLKDNGWEAEVIAVNPEAVAAPLDEWMAEGLPPDVPVHRIKALGLAWSAVPGLGTLGFRALPAVRRKGEELLSSRRFDLVYFSTTQWPVHLAGPAWKKRHAVPFAMDYQDPWVNDYYRQHPEVVPPGGRLRYGLAAALNRWMEPRVLRESRGYTSVSAAYPRQLHERYAWAAGIPHEVIPFPGSERDFERVRKESEPQKQFDTDDGREHWVYVGRGGKDMETAARALFAALAAESSWSAGLRNGVRIHFIGTSYAPAGKGRPSIAPIAAEFGLQDMVMENTDRISYRETLRCLTQADALLALCSNDPGYTASKIYPCLLAGKPLLAICHEKSGVAQVIAEAGGAVCATFGQSGDPVATAAAAIGNDWLSECQWQRTRPLNRNGLEKYLERRSAKQLVSFWERVVRDEGFAAKNL